jgi:hypothetical protein
MRAARWTAPIALLLTAPVLASPAPLAEPDLAVVDVGTGHPLPDVGDALEFRATVVRALATNTTPPQAVAVQFLLDGHLVEERTATLGEGWTLTLRSAPWTATLGDHLLTVVVDPHGEVAEDDEANNQLSTWFTVAPRPDVRLLGIAWSPEQPLVGEQVVVRATYANVGTAAALGGTVTIHVGWVPTKFALDLAPGQVATFESRPWMAYRGYDSLLRPSDVPLLVQAQVPGEHRTADNDGTAQMRIHPPPAIGVAAEGPSRGLVAASGDDAAGAIALAIGGEASGVLLAATATGQARSLVLAASLAGDAAACQGQHFDVPVCAAASGLGDAKGFAAVSGTGDARGTVAISATGRAEGTALRLSGCDLAGACLDPA